MRAQLWSLLELQLCRPTWPPERSSWYPKEGLGVLVGTTLKHCECARWDAKRQGQDWTETWPQQPCPSKHKWGRGTVPMFTTGLVPRWSAHAGNKYEFESLFMLEGVNPWPSCPRAPCKAAMRESPLHPAPCMLGHHWQRHMTCRALSTLRKEQNKGQCSCCTLKIASPAQFCILSRPVGSWANGGTTLRYRHPREGEMLRHSPANYLPVQSASFSANLHCCLDSWKNQPI